MTGPLDAVPAAHRTDLRPSAPPDTVTPMLAVLTGAPFSDDAWIYERKLDGERVVAIRDGDDVRLRSRTGHDLGGTYPEIADALAAQDQRDFVVDGEVVAFDGNATSFSRLQRRFGLHDPEAARATGIAVHLYAFDVLHVAGYDTSALPARIRKAVLRRTLRWRDPLRYSAHRVGDGEAYFALACERGWEGLIAKRAEAPYQPRRSRDWLKFKCVNEQEFVIGGFTDPEGHRHGFGALLIGYYADGDLRYAGKVGTGYDERTLRDLRARLDERVRTEQPFAGARVRERGAHWVRPELVAEVAFTEWTGDGKLRHPRYLGLRRDKDPKDVRREGAGTRRP